MTYKQQFKASKKWQPAIIKYKNFIIKEYLFKYDSGYVYDISYSLYDKNNKFLTNYFNKTFEEVVNDINEFWSDYHVL